MKQFTPEQEKGICSLYRHNSTIRNIQRVFHCKIEDITRVLSKHRVHIRAAGAPPYVPTPEDIERGTAKIRETWDDEERNARAGGNGRVPFTVPLAVDQTVGNLYNRSRQHGSI